MPTYTTRSLRYNWDMKKVWIAIAAIFGVAVICFGILVGMAVIKDRDGANVFHAAMEEYRAIINAEEPNPAKIEELADQISSSENYAVIEKAAKEYLRDVLVPFWKAAEITDADIYKSGISKTVLETDAPEFQQSLATISSATAALDAVQKASELFSREAAMKYLSEDLDDYYIDLYDDQVEEIYSDQQMRQNYLEYVQSIQKMNTNFTEVINFLAANNGKWHLEGDTIVFKTVALTNQYNQILARIAEQ